MPHAAVAVEPHDEAIALFSGFLQRVDVAGVQQVEAAVGHGDPTPALAKPLELAEELIDREDLVRRCVTDLGKLSQHFAPGDGNHAETLDLQSAGQVGQLHGRGMVGSGGHSVSDGREDHVARARDVRDLAGAAAKQRGVAPCVGPGDAVAIEGDRGGLDAEAEHLAGDFQALVRGGDLRSQGQPGLRAIGRDAGTSGIAMIVGPGHRVGDYRDTGRSRPTDHLGDEVARAYPLVVIADHHQVGLLQTSAQVLQEFVGQLARNRLSALAVHAHHVVGIALLRAAQKSLFDSGGPVRIDQHAAALDFDFAEQLADHAAFVVVAGDGPQPGPGVERREHRGHVSGPAQPVLLAAHAKHGDRCFRADPFDVAPLVTVEHDVADQQDPRAERLFEQGNEWVRHPCIPLAMLGGLRPANGLRSERTRYCSDPRN